VYDRLLIFCTYLTKIGCVSEWDLFTICSSCPKLPRVALIAHRCKERITFVSGIERQRFRIQQLNKSAKTSGVLCSKGINQQRMGDDLAACATAEESEPETD